MGASSSKGQKKRDKSGDKVIGRPQKFSKKWSQKVLSQESNSICQITTNRGKNTGFLCKVPNPVLITSSEALISDEIKPGKQLKITFTDEEDKKESKTIRITEKKLLLQLEN